MNIPTIKIESPSGKTFTYLSSTSNLSVSLSSLLDDAISTTSDQSYIDESQLKMLNVSSDPEKSADSDSPLISRRKSFSLPNGLEGVEIKTLKDQYKTEDSIESRIVERNNISSTHINFKTENNVLSSPVSHKRKKGIIHLGALHVFPHEMDINRVEDCLESNSNNNSVTSMSSLANLLKEKIQTLPIALKKRRGNEFQMKLIVAFLFLMIIFLISVAHILYYQQVIQKAYFEKIKFNKFKRVIKFYNSDNAEIIRGYLGRQHLSTDAVYNCLDKDNRDNDTVCLEWTNKARLYLNFKQVEDNIRCYTLYWQSLSRDFHPNDCFDWSRSKSHWYGGGQNSASSWPLEKTAHNFVPFITGDAKKYSWGSSLRRYFINSKGIAIRVHEDTPLYVSLNEHGNKMVCLEGRFDDFAYANRPSNVKYSTLNYTICSGQNISSLHNFLSEKTLWDGLKQADVDVITSLISEPVWEIVPRYKETLTEALVHNFTESVISLGFLKQGHVLIDENWQKTVGDFTIDTNRLETLDETITVMHRRGFKIVLTIQPFISTESVNFATCARKKILIFERDTDVKIPSLTHYKSTHTAAVLDITNSRTFPWLLKQLKQLLHKYKIDAFFIDFGFAYNIPRFYQMEKPLRNPDEYKNEFLSLSEGNINVFGVSGSVNKLKPPIFVMLLSAEPTWDGIRTVIPNVLSYGIIGYPFLIPGAIGGDVFTQPLANSSLRKDDILRYLPEKELYKRWFQMSTFFPVMKFRFLPDLYHDVDLIEMVKALTLLRQKIITPVLNKFARESLNSGLPIIRPLWLLEPNEPACYTIADEFLVGDELLVAPIVTKGVKQREVYLPSGVWKDGIDGSLRKGSRWIYNYKIGENQVAYFMRMPDNTRF